MKAKGFTLIEVLLAMMLLSIVMYIGSLSFALFSERWQKELGDFNTDVNDARKLLLLGQVVNDASNYLYKDSNGSLNYFFNGDSKNISFVSKQPVFNQDGSAVVHLTIKTLDNGQQQLWYNEFPLNTLGNTNTAFSAVRTNTLLLLQANNIRFNYYGWQDQAEFNNYFENRAVQPVWTTSYHAGEKKLMPYAVNISWAENEPLIIPLSTDNGYNFRYHYVETD